MIKNQFNIFFFIILYASLVVGFFFGEDLNYGATGDWYHTDFPVIKDLSINLKKTLLNYEIYGHRHSPVYLIILSQLRKIGFSYDLIRFLHLNISILLIFFFYKCLELKFDSIKKSILILLSLSIFLSPTFRSLAIWPSTRSVGLIFFVLSIYEFLKFQKNNLNIHIWKNLFFLIISSYISPNFSLFIIYFFYHYSKKLKINELIQISLFCLFLSLPAFYYIFILDINFLTAGTPGKEIGQAVGLSYNFSNKILIISTIVFFHLIPFLISKKFFENFRKSITKNIVLVIIFLIINIIFFNYVIKFTGGGIFFQFSNYLFKTNLIFYFFCFLSLMLLAFLIRNNINNFLIFFLLILSNLQNTIYHKYYDPLIMILFFTVMDNFLSKDFLNKKINLFFLYGFYIIYIFIRVAKNTFFSI